jgi:acyl-CoA reductase-like NAD-dependent aldehyde dehydrogenase
MSTTADVKQTKSNPNQPDEWIPVAGRVSQAAKAQACWARTTFKARVRILRRFRHLFVAEAERFCAEVAIEHRTPAETLAAEIIPLADACRFLERNASRELQPKRYGSWLRWLGLPSVSVEVRRHPFGVVLIIGPANYPLFLPAVQALQAIAAGNAAVVKPGRCRQRLLCRFAHLLGEAGLPEGVVTVLGESPVEAQEAIAAGVDKVFLTGSAGTGREVLAQLADSLTPAVMELSGCDALVVLDDADLDRVADCVRFGQQFNQGDTCILPRRFLCAANRMSEASQRMPGISFQPFRSDEEAAQLVNRNLHGLGLSIFGSRRRAMDLAGICQVGCVTVNDVIAPTADPRLPFGGRKQSGFGVTRGIEGLLEMTTVQAVASRHGRWLPHLRDPSSTDAAVLECWLKARHSSTWARRWTALCSLVRAARASSNSNDRSGAEQ